MYRCCQVSCYLEVGIADTQRRCCQVSCYLEVDGRRQNTTYLEVDSRRPNMPGWMMQVITYTAPVVALCWMLENKSIDTLLLGERTRCVNNNASNSHRRRKDIQRSCVWNGSGAYIALAQTFDSLNGSQCQVPYVSQYAMRDFRHKVYSTLWRAHQPLSRLCKLADNRSRSADKASPLSAPHVLKG